MILFSKIQKVFVLGFLFVFTIKPDIYIKNKTGYPLTFLERTDVFGSISGNPYDQKCKYKRLLFHKEYPLDPGNGYWSTEEKKGGSFVRSDVLNNGETCRLKIKSFWYGIIGFCDGWHRGLGKKGLQKWFNDLDSSSIDSFKKSAIRVCIQPAEKGQPEKDVRTFVLYINEKTRYIEFGEEGKI